MQEATFQSPNVKEQMIWTPADLHSFYSVKKVRKGRRGCKYPSYRGSILLPEFVTLRYFPKLSFLCPIRTIGTCRRSALEGQLVQCYGDGRYIAFSVDFFHGSSPSWICHFSRHSPLERYRFSKKDMSPVQLYLLWPIQKTIGITKIIRSIPLWTSTWGKIATEILKLKSRDRNFRDLGRIAVAREHSIRRTLRGSTKVSREDALTLRAAGTPSTCHMLRDVQITPLTVHLKPSDTVPGSPLRRALFWIRLSL
jgi:hypothetical protein